MKCFAQDHTYRRKPECSSYVTAAARSDRKTPGKSLWLLSWQPARLRTGVHRPRPTSGFSPTFSSWARFQAWIQRSANGHFYYSYQLFFFKFQLFKLEIMIFDYSLHFFSKPTTSCNTAFAVHLPPQLGCFSLWEMKGLKAVKASRISPSYLYCKYNFGS